MASFDLYADFKALDAVDRGDDDEVEKRAGGDDEEDAAVI